MPICITCPSCQTSYALGDEFGGKKVRCRQCKEVISVPGGESGIVDKTGAAPIPSRPATRGGATPQAAKKKSGALVVVLVLGLLGVGAVVVLGGGALLVGIGGCFLCGLSTPGKPAGDPIAMKADEPKAQASKADPPKTEPTKTHKTAPVKPPPKDRPA